MKATQRDFARVARRAAGTCAIAFFCGPDEGGTAAAADKFVALLAEPGERFELSGADLKADPVTLVDEARSSSLFGGTRHIYVRAAGEEAHDAVQAFLDMADLGETRGACPIVIVATSATDKSRTAKLLAGRPDALVAMFHPPDLDTITAEVRTMGDAAGLRLDGDLANRIARASSLDVRLARSEVEKLALYLDASPQSPRSADVQAFEAIGAKNEEEGMMPLVNVVLSGEVRKLPGELARMQELGLNAVGVALALERRVAQLALLAGKVRAGDDASALLERQRVFFRDRHDIQKQLGRWNVHKLDRLVLRLADLHRELLGNSRMAELLLARALTQIARFAAAGR